MILSGSITLLIGCVMIVVVPSRIKGLISFLLVVLYGSISSGLAFRALTGHPFEFTLVGSLPLGAFPLRIDALSAWFILIINFSMVTGALYGISYMKVYAKQRANLSLHWVLFVIFYVSMLSVCIIQNGFAFLIAWEIMSISSMLLLLFEYSKPETIKAGLNYLVQMHVSVVFLTLAVIGIFSQTNSFDFAMANQLSPSLVMPLFFCFSIGFAFKAGFIPLHTWLPLAHPAAPSHISGIMSGVMIKIGIYGILRMILAFPLAEENRFLLIGWVVLGVSIASGLYGIMQAIVQHNLKKMLAYSSIENIGVMGIGIGLGCIGLGLDNGYIATAGFMSSLLHILNHSLFKSILFQAAGNVYRAAHTLRLESLGGLVKKIPQSTFLFLLAALAISGFPPFNAFISEFLLYSGLYHGAIHASTITSIMLLLATLALVMISGMTMFCFIKAFGVVFLGTARNPPSDQAVHESPGDVIAMYLTAIPILLIGIFPASIVNILHEVVRLFDPDINPVANVSILLSLQQVSRAVLLFLAITLTILLIRYWISSRRSIALSATWGCGYGGETSRMQYTGNSFSRMFRRLAAPILSVHRVVVEIDEVFPQINQQYETHPLDALELYLIQKPVGWLSHFLSLFRFLQNGKIQHYLLYGIVFILFIGFLSLFKVI